ncbi:MAG: DMT family transporter [Paracoccaceae bacterium]
MPSPELPAPAARSGNGPLGIAFAVAAVMVFATGDVATKYLMLRYDVAFVVAVRYLVNLALLLAVLGPRHGRALIRTRRTRMVLFRAACLVSASLTMGLALQTMPVGETIAIIYLAPFGVMALAVLFLGERVSPLGWACAAVAFAGVLLIVRPGSALAPLGVVFALMTALASVGYNFLSRSLAATESTAALLFVTALVGSAAFCLTAPFTWTGRLPGGFDSLVMLALGVIATLGHFLFTAAFREAPASVLAPINYVHLVFAAILGWAFFAHVPDGPTLAGMGLVVAAGAISALRPARPPVAEPVP